MERQWYRKKSYVMKWRQWGNIGETVVQKEKLCDEVETVGNIGETVGEYWRDSGAG